MHSESKKADFVTYRSMNWSIQRISEKIGVSPRTLADWNGQYKDAIANLRYLHADVHFQNLVETRQKDVQLLTTRQQALDSEIAQRDLGDIPTDKLIRLAMLSRGELLQACDHAKSLVKDESYIPDPVPWYVRERAARSSMPERKENPQPSEAAETPNSQKDIEPVNTPARETQPEGSAEISPGPTGNTLEHAQDAEHDQNQPEGSAENSPASTNETPAIFAECDTPETASAVVTEQNPSASNDGVPT